MHHTAGHKGHSSVLHRMNWLACIFTAHSGLQETSSGGAGILSGKQSHLGSFIRSHAKMLGSSLYKRPLMEFLHTFRLSEHRPRQTEHLQSRIRRQSDNFV